MTRDITLLLLLVALALALIGPTMATTARFAADLAGSFRGATVVSAQHSRHDRALVQGYPLATRTRFFNSPATLLASHSRRRAMSIALMRSLGLAAGILLGLSQAGAQQTGADNQGRDCKTVRTCNFARDASVRGCLSSYSCRTCRTVTVRCRIPGTGPTCQELRCDWGG